MSSHPAFANPSSRHIAPHAPHGENARHAPPHHDHPHHLAAAAKPAGHRRRGVWIWAVGGLVAGGAAIAILVALSGGSGDTGADFMRRMDAAAQGTPLEGAPGGAAIRAERTDDGVIVTATGVSPKDCVGAGWQLVRKGVLTINGNTPQRVSGAVLAELCNQQDGATLRWAPRKAP